MVRVLIGLRRTVARNQLRSAGAGWLVGGLVLGLLCAGGTLALGVVHYQQPGAATDVLALVYALWILGRVAQSALTGGDAILRPELFSLLPVPRRRLAASLLVVNLVVPSLVLLAIAAGGLIAFGAHEGPAQAVVGLAGLVLTVALASVASTIAGGLLAPGSRRGHDTGTIVLAVGLGILAVIGTLLPVLAAALRNRSSPVLSWLVRLLPSGWGPVAVDAAGHADWLLAAGALLGMLAVIVACALAWPQVLGRRMEGAAHPSRAAGGSRRTRLPTGGSPTGRGRRLLTGASPTGSVASKELRLWGRDPIRLTCLLIAVIVGTAVCAVPLATARTTILLPFAGLLTTVIAGACACILYGSDGTSLWLTVLTPASSRPDARGRQLAWLILVARTPWR